MSKETYDIVMIGRSNAGKTVYLASLFYQLFEPVNELGFYLLAPIAQRKELINRITALRHNREWPDSTLISDFTTWDFHLMVEQGETVYNPISFRYFDYAGELISSGKSGETTLQQQFYDRAKRSHAVAYMIDGQVIFNHLEYADKEAGGNEENPEATLSEVLFHLVSDITDIRVPVHLVITKWDILEAKGYSLEQVRDTLLQVREFSNFIKHQNKSKKPIRLIPLSSTGKEFASLQPDGHMQINAHSELQPLQVEVPLACVIFDYWSQRLREELEKMKLETESLAQEVEVHIQAPRWQRFTNRVGGLVTSIASRGEARRELLISVGNYLQRPMQKTKQEAEHETALANERREERLLRVTDDTTALEAAMAALEAVVVKFENQYPASTL